MSSSQSVKVQGPSYGLVGLLTIVFVVLKLVGVIAWSWWWVLSPLWITLGAGVVIFLGAVLIFFLTAGKK